MDSPVALCGKLLSVAAAGAIGLGAGFAALSKPAHAGPDACVANGTTVICSGDQSNGVASGVDFNPGSALPGPFTALIVQDLDLIISPAAGVDGINFTSAVPGNISITSDTRPFGIMTSGAGAEGISALLTGTSGNVTVNSSGNITTQGDGSEGIRAVRQNNDGDVTVVSNGNISTTGQNASGIFARQENGNGNLSVTSTGDINVNNDTSDGIAVSQIGGDGNVSINSTGNVTSGTERGLFALQGAGNGDILVNSTGNIQSSNDGIVAQQSGGNGDVSVNSNGNIQSSSNDGIFAQQTGGDGDIFVTSNGNIQADDDGIHAQQSGGNGDITVISTGNIAAIDDSTAISAQQTGGNGDILVINQADIQSSSNGIAVQLAGGDGDIRVSNSGVINVPSENGIRVNHLAGTGQIVVDNSGVISGRRGILITARNNNAAIINNFAALTGTNGFAIALHDDGNDVVNLGGGTVLNGSIDFGNGNDNMGGTNPNDIDTLNALPGFNGVITFADDEFDSDLQSAPEVTSSNIAVINGGLTAVAVDPSGFAASGVFLGTLTGTIFNSIDNSGAGPESGTATHGGDGAYEYGTGYRSWVSGFGGHQEVGAGTNNAGLDHGFGGLVAGVENGSGDGTFGFFGGYGASRIDVAFAAGSTDVDTVFGGTYWKRDYGSHRIHLALVAGSAEHEFRRNVGGMTALGEANGWFISPSLTLAAPVEWFPAPAIASVRTSYSALFLNGYTETGVALPLTVGDRDVHLFNTRAQIAFPHLIANADGSHSHLEFRTGLDAQFDAGSGNVNAAVSGTAISFNADLDDELSGFAGVSLTRTNPDESVLFSVSGELQSAFNGSYNAVGEAKITLRF